MTIRLLLVEDHAALRDAMSTGLADIGRVTVCAATNNGADALALHLAHEPDAILMDVRLDGEINGIEAAVAIRREFPRMPVVFYSIQDDDNYYRAFRRAAILSHYAYVRKSNYLLPRLLMPLLVDAVAGRHLSGADEWVDPAICNTPAVSLKETLNGAGQIIERCRHDRRRRDR